ncbi:filamentous hemagglutinin N-terminal domain-containing protein, partial [Campylobacter armoricus]|uniref:two-partner secretion domain-containing protein n=1 Tax=Campylobacter armoricus TaxID=2505970 RepID=UPI00111792F5
MLIFSPRGGGSNNFNLISSCKKLSKQILLSNIVASLLFSSTFALPSGGKFTHNTSGNIITNGNNIHINGNGTNSVIQWGGGFSIGKGESVNFNGNNKNYLNIAHGTSKSTIDGLLNANGNNVFLINPNGVIITKNGTINANRFVASTTSLEARHFEEFKTQGANFSPVFKPNKLGNVVNMGNINANKVLLIGNKVDIQGGNINGKHNDNVSGNALKNPSSNMADKIHLVGNEVLINIGKTNLKANSNSISAINKAFVYISASDYYNNTNLYNKYNFTKENYQSSINNAKDIERFVGIGSDIDWWHFAKGWNEDKEGFRDTASEYRLTNDIDFKGNKGQGVEGKDWQNYANYCIDGLGCTSMIVGLIYYFSGDYKDAFNKTFDGQGYTLKNINIDTTSLDNKPYGVGIFGSISGATIKNINVDYMGGGIKSDTSDASIGGFVGLSDGYTHKVTFSNISLNNIGSIVGTSIRGNSNVVAGGFVGWSFDGSIFSNISLNNIGSISSGSHAGGFAGGARGTFSNISLNNIGSISASGSGGG